MLKFTPTENRILASVNSIEDGKIHATVERVGEDVTRYRSGDSIFIDNIDYHEMVIEGIQCVLVEEHKSK